MDGEEGMSLTEYFRLIGAPKVNAGAAEEDILAAEARLGGRFPDGLRAWFRETDGFDGEAKESMWRFASLERLHTIFDIFGEPEITVTRPRYPDRRVAGAEYMIVCDALYYLPFYAVNICPGSPGYSEVICGYDQTGPSRDTTTSTWFGFPAFEAFADWLYTHPDDFLYVED